MDNDPEPRIIIGVTYALITAALIFAVLLAILWMVTS